MSKLRIVSLTAFMILITAVANAAGSAGFECGIDSASALGKGNAIVADPQDASTLVYNPAALSEVKGRQLAGNFSVIVPGGHYEATNGHTEDSSQQPIYIPAMFLKADTPYENLKMAAGIHSPYGLNDQYSSTGAFKYIGYSNSIKNIFYTAGASYEINPWFSIGMTGSYVDTSVKQMGKINSDYISQLFGAPAGTPDAETEVEMRGHGGAWSIGAYGKPHTKVALGALYRSSMKTRVRGELSVDNIQGLVMPGIFGGSSFHTTADTDYELPDSFIIGALYRATEKLDLELDLSWTGWAKFDRFDVAYGKSNAVLDGGEPAQHQFRNTLSLNFGATYHLNPNWDLMAGYMYYERAAEKVNYTNIFPDGDRHIFTTGFKYRVKDFSFSTSYAAMIFSEVSIDNNMGSASNVSVDGKYSSFYNLILSSVTYDF